MTTVSTQTSKIHIVKWLEILCDGCVIVGMYIPTFNKGTKKQ